jgi:hypothetical protein
VPEEWQAVLNPKKKIAEKLLPLLTTSATGEGLFNGIKMTTTKGAGAPMTAKKVMGGVIG